MRSEIIDTLRAVQDHVREYEPIELDGPDELRDIPVVPETTGVPLETLEQINNATVDLPEGFTPHPKLWQQLKVLLLVST